ncbi:MAG TPA: hypothetical protein VGN29_13245 [Solirubrobacteraceae bacterium]|nr:hypothetical protein [Solirubrobacteraceae bacterium]
MKSRHPAQRNSAETVASASYEIRIKGELHKSVLAMLGDFAASTRAPETVLSGALPDQHALHDVLARIQSLGLELLAIRRLSDPGESRIQPSSVEAGCDSPPLRDDGVTLRLAVRR